MVEESFGDILRTLRRNSRDALYGGQLSQNRLADLLSEETGMVYSRAAISDWERGKGHIHKDARPVLVGLVKILHQAGGLATRREAERWLAAGNYRALSTAEAAGIDPGWSAPPAGEPAAGRPFLPPLMPQHPIIGRVEALGKLKEWLFDNRSLALSSINGLPGVGKTALALLAAHDPDVRQRFPDGVLWVGLGTNPDIFALLGRWAKAVGIPEEEVAKLGAQRMRVDAIHQTIRSRQMLIVIDDVWETRHALPFKLGGAQSAHILTSRQPPIAAAFAGPHAMTVRELSEAQSLELLRWLAPRVIARNEADARHLVALSGGLPLALVLIGNALRLNDLSGSERRIQNTLDMLKWADERLRIEQVDSLVAGELHPDLEPGTAISLYAIIEVTDNRLGSEARAALRGLALFPPKPNSFSEAAALSVTGAMTETLDLLVDHGLLETVERDRYALHQSIHDYAGLEPRDPAREESLIAYYQSCIDLNRENRQVLERELDNIQAALQLAAAGGRQEALWGLLESLMPFFSDRGYYDLAMTMLERVEVGVTGINPAVKHYLGRLELLRENADKAQAHWEAGLIAARLADDRVMVGRLLNSMSQLASQRRDFATAAAYLDESAALAQAAGDWEEVARMLGNFGRLAYVRDDFDIAESYLRRAQEVAATHDLHSLSSGILNLLGIVLMSKGDLEAAEQTLQAGLEIARAHRLEARISTLLANMGELLNEMGRFDAATAYLEEGVELSRRLNDPGQESHMLLDLGIAKAAQGAYEAAIPHFSAAHELAAGLDNPWQVALVKARWGIAALEAGDAEQARPLLVRAAELAPNVASSAKIEGLSRFGLAKLAIADGDRETAAAQSAAALAVLQTHGLAPAVEVAAWRAGQGFSSPP